MYISNFAICMLCWLLGCASGMTESERMGQQKLQQLLRTLGNYSKPVKGRLPSTMPKSSETMTIEFSHHLIKSTNPTAASAAVASSSSIHRESPQAHIHHNDTTRFVNSKLGFYNMFFPGKEGIHIFKGRHDLKHARTDVGDWTLNDLRLANEHSLRILNSTRCRLPIAHVIRVKDYFPDPSKIYHPRCTVLHRCGATSGCCHSTQEYLDDTLHCVPSVVQEVALRFYTLTVGRNGLDDEPGVQTLLFVNHTACECRPINDLPRRATQTIKKTKQPCAETAPKPTSKPHPPKCLECPMPFTSRLHKDGRCGCDCFDRQKPCLKIKKGREPLYETERRCVEANYCHAPDCEHGMFNIRTGYCPKRPDDAPINRRNHHPSKHIRLFMERD